MKKIWLMSIPVSLLFVFSFVVPAFSNLRGWKIDEFLIKDPVCKKWLVLEKNTTKQFGAYNNEGKIWEMTKDCSSLFNCQFGWDAFLGNPSADYAEFWGDSLSHTEDKEWGENAPIWKFNEDDAVGPRACTAAPLWNFKDAATLIAKTINTPKKIETLWCGTRDSSMKDSPYRALWLIGAKDQADVMIKGMALKPRAESKCAQKHTTMFLAVADAWKLSKAQNTEIEKTCLAIFQSTESHDKANVGGCIRYLGRTKTTSSDAVEFIKNYMGDSQQKHEAARALAFMAVKDTAVKNEWLKRVEQNKREKTVNKKKITWYDRNFEVGIGVVALYGMGDSTGEKVIKDYLGWDKTKKELTNPNGFKMLMTDAPFVADSHRKKLAGLIGGVFKDVVKLAGVKSQYDTYAMLAAVALVQLGDKAGLAHVLDILKGNDQNLLRDLFEYIGETPDALGGAAKGLGYVRVGKDGLTEKEARQIIDTIKARFKFWSNSNHKHSGLKVALDIEARLKAAK
ncbi:hypothetical protein KKD52_11265 [Myxococcota bacterium]|nr:hypothetical protein [Myxococcota bacterium]MBU1510931.1 hypothetical protein [Myxococcota bacterium]